MPAHADTIWFGELAHFIALPKLNNIVKLKI